MIILWGRRLPFLLRARLFRAKITLMPLKNQQFNSYLQKLKERKDESRAYSKHQVVGLEIAELLDDFSHKALYIKLAKERNSDKLLATAKEISEKQYIKNKGAYFMRIISEDKK